MGFCMGVGGNDAAVAVRQAILLQVGGHLCGRGWRGESAMPPRS